MTTTSKIPLATFASALAVALLTTSAHGDIIMDWNAGND